MLDNNKDPINIETLANFPRVQYLAKTLVENPSSLNNSDYQIVLIDLASKISSITRATNSGDVATTIDDIDPEKLLFAIENLLMDLELIIGHAWYMLK